ncbi:glycoside hydrolase family 47 protein [Phanerochaete carnosa HHB-10118-sp]|uniref:alpha-1,2-Mannosidase n=1 Tax=Phanerochaete carnosa (strain HHB-10118-sp) TaxID=650164 RepID=K5WCT5_PHACS|nr:glycoside hydrolase family 47 protein [Phanerochaete carnosa HHB-10118-sp]EKM61778.1 glycoside hydrolase family 47 protein [Phanerochaete carnosa HHB-10118-sp]
MADPTVRKRKTAPTRPSNGAGDATPTGGNAPTKRTAGSVKLSTILSLLLIAIGTLSYQQPRLVQGIIDSVSSLIWKFKPLPGTGQNLVAEFIPDMERRDAVVRAFQHAWHAYESDAMGDDEYHPIGHTGSNLTAAGGIGYTVVDSLDTMIIMRLEDDYKRAREWIATKLDFEKDADFNTFETTIRVLGGLLSAYSLTGDDLFLEKAQDLADRILPAFDTPSGLPTSLINLALREGVMDPDNPELVSTAEVSTLQLEFRYLAHLTDNEEYWHKAEKVMRIIKNARLSTGLASIFMNKDGGRYALSAIRLGSRGDSYYEYLLKQYIQTNMTEHVYREMYDDAMDSVAEHLISRSQKAKLIYTSELVPQRTYTSDIAWRLVPKQDHLVCFFGGSLMLGATITGATQYPISVPPRPEQLTKQGKRDWVNGVELIKTCMKTHETKTGLAPEIAHFRIPSDNLDETIAPDDWYIKGGKPGAEASYDARYILRPETVESLFIAYRLTGDPRYREYGWSIFQAIEKYCRIESGGYASVLNVDEVPVKYEDKMETFLMSETLKYLYLLFDDDKALPLDKYVFNTEAHPLPIFYPTFRTGFS